jgi:hypothetical protein
MKIADALHFFLVGKLPNFKTSRLEDEIYLESVVDGRLMTSAEVNSALADFKLSDPTFEKCIIKSLGGNVFVIAFQVNVEDIGLHKCPTCGYMLKSKDELEFHEKTSCVGWPVG